MELALLFVPLAIAGAVAGRWTRWNPLLIGGALGLVPGVLGLVGAAAFATDARAILLFAAIAYCFGTTIAALAAFIGWLRRNHVKRII